MRRKRSSKRHPSLKDSIFSCINNRSNPTMPIEKVIRRVGDIDALAFFIFWATVGMVFSTHWYGALPIIFTFLVPASVIVGLRGRASVPKYLSGSANWKSAVVEGVGWGVGYTLLFWILAMSKESWAAGTVLTGQSPATAQFWLTVITSVSPPLLIAAVAGAASAMGLFSLNSWLVKRFTRTAL